MDYGRRTSKGNDRTEEAEIQKSLKVSSYMDNIYESIHTGAAPKVNVPNYQQPTRGEIFSEIASESQGLNMNFDSITGSMSDEQVKTAMGDTLPERQDGQKTFNSHNSHNPLPQQIIDNQPRFTVSRNQAMALKKYPTLIEFLGRPEGEKVARQISGDMNVLMAELVSANSKEANVCAKQCIAEKQNLRQYFQGEDWICRVTASGPFHGDEAIYYSRNKDAACVLRRSEIKVGNETKIDYTNISDQFNIIYEAEQGEISVNADEKIAEIASAEEGENNEIITDVKIDETAKVDETTG